MATERLLEEWAGKLSAGAPLALDPALMAEELHGMGRGDLNAIRGHLEILILHLLKAEYQPERKSSSWARSIRNSRKGALNRLKAKPGLAVRAQSMFPSAYQVGRRRAAKETGLDLNAFPSVPPWPYAKVLDETFYP